MIDETLDRELSTAFAEWARDRMCQSDSESRLIGWAQDKITTLTRERDEALKKLEKIKEISQVWNVVDDDATTKIIALNRIHIIAGGKT